MSLVTAGVSNAYFNLNVTQQSVSPLSVAPTLSIPLTFANTTFVNSVVGTFTPTNSTVTIAAFTAAQAPTWMLLVVDNPIQLTTTLSGGVTTGLKVPIQRMSFQASPSPTAAFSTAVIDGTTTGYTYLMSQTTAVNYQLIYGNGTVS